MKIMNTNIWTMSSKVEQKSRNRYGGKTLLERTVLRLEDDSGCEGWGEMMPITFTDESPAEATAAIEQAAAKLKGREISNPATEVDRLFDFTKLQAARSCVESSLLDLDCQRKGQPFSAILGGERRSKFEFNGPIGLVSPDEAIEKTKKYLVEGISTVKVKVGADFDPDAERLLALREAFGDKINLRMDANGGYTPEEAIRFCTKILPARVEHFEQPVSPSEARCFDIFREIREMGIQVAADESLFTLADARMLIEEDAVDVGVIKISKFGGPLAAAEVTRTLEAAGKSCVLSASYESYIGKSVGLALAVSLEKCDRAHELGHFAAEAVMAEWRHDITGCVFTRGEGPGLGARGLADSLDSLAAIAPS